MSTTPRRGGSFAAADLEVARRQIMTSRCRNRGFADALDGKPAATGFQHDWEREAYAAGYDQGSQSRERYKF